MTHLCHGVCNNELCGNLFPYLVYLKTQVVLELIYLLLLFENMSICYSAPLVGSYVWSHLTNVLRSEDPMKQALTESMPDDIISRDFEAEFLKYSSYADYTVSSGNDGYSSTVMK